MRHLRLSVGLLATTCALAFGAAPALAHEFIASTSNKTGGTAETEQVFKFGPFKIKCGRANAKGLVAAGSSETYATSIKFAKCLTEAKLGVHDIFLGTRFLTPLAVEYHANGFVETGSELEEFEGSAVLAGGSAEIKVNQGKTEEGKKAECHIVWPEQTLPIRAVKKPTGEYSDASYANETKPHNVTKAFPDGLQHFIKISNTFTGIQYEFVGEPCEEYGRQETAEGRTGKYTGSFPQLLTGGNLEFQ
jgi:hypothetical protein